MENTRSFVLMAAAALLLAGGLVTAAEAQTRVRVQRVERRPVVIRRVYFYPRYYDPFYDPYFRVRNERRYLESRLNGDERELREHREKYRRDGILTPKEREELADDVRDVRESRARLQRYVRYDRRYRYY